MRPQTLGDRAGFIVIRPFHQWSHPGFTYTMHEPSPPPVQITYEVEVPSLHPELNVASIQVHL